MMENEKTIGPMDKNQENLVTCAGYLAQIHEAAENLCKLLPVESRQEYLDKYDDRYSPDLSVSDIESGKADEYLEPYNLTRALIVAAFNADRRGQSKFE